MNLCLDFPLGKDPSGVDQLLALGGVKERTNVDEAGPDQKCAVQIGLEGKGCVGFVWSRLPSSGGMVHLY